jgi:hypothetical protein
MDGNSLSESLSELLIMRGQMTIGGGTVSWGAGVHSHKSLEMDPF